MEGILQLIQCRTASLETMRAIDSRLSKSTLRDPHAHQVIVAAALQLGNDSLLIHLVSSSPPGPKHELLFGVKDERASWSKPDCKPTESGDSHAHMVFENSSGNIANVWDAMIRTGWAVPQPYMRSWAATNPVAESGIRLVNTLAKVGRFQFGLLEVYSAAIYGQADVFDHLLTMYTPTGRQERHRILEMAAYRADQGAQHLEACFRHGIEDINWVGENNHEEITQGMDPIAHAEMDAFGDTPESTPLHAAARAGNIPAIELLVSRRARSLWDGYGRNPVDAAKYYVKPDAVAVLIRLGFVASNRKEEYVHGSPEYEALRARKMEEYSS